jgi:DNA (cytosine-5)-methyltransferase 1
MMGSRENPIIIPDFDDEATYVLQQCARRQEQYNDEWHQVDQQLAQLYSQVDANRRPSDASSLLEAEQELVEEILEDHVREVVDLTGDDADEILTATYENGTKIEWPITEYRLPNGLVLHRGVDVELVRGYGEWNVQYLRILSIFREPGNPEVMLRGLGFTRTRELYGMLPPKLNEVALVAEILSSNRPWLDQAVFVVAASEVLRQRDIRITNAPFPEHRFDRRDYVRRGQMWIEENGPLVCRFKFEAWYHGLSPRPYEKALTAFSEDEADPKYRISDHENRYRWRGGKIPGGSYNPHGPQHPIFDLDTGLSDLEQYPRLWPDQRYSAGDIFEGHREGGRPVNVCRRPLEARRQDSQKELPKHPSV